MANVKFVDYGGQQQQQAMPPPSPYRSALAEAILARGMDTQNIRTPIQGLAKLGETAIGAITQRQEAERERAKKAQLGQEMSGALQAASPWINPDTGMPAPGTGGREGLAAFLQSASPEMQAALGPQLLASALDPGEQAKGVEVNGKLVDPVTGKVIYSGPTPNAMSDPFEMNGELVQQNLSTGEIKPVFGRTSSTSVRVDAGNKGPNIGTIPKDMQLVGNDQEGYRFEVIPGSETAREREMAAEKASGGQESRRDSASVVLEDIARAKTLVSESPQLTTGFFGNILKDWAGTKAANVRALTDTIGANISFDKLNQMRQNSPTGGALGSVTERELSLLSAVQGNIEQSQTAEQLLYNMNRLEDTMGSIVHGPAYSRVPQEYRNLTPEQASRLEPGSLFTGTDGVPRVKQ